MSSPRLRRPISLVLVEIAVVLLIVGSWVQLLGLAVRTYFGTGGGYLDIGLVPFASADVLADGVHSVGKSAEAAARLIERGTTLRLFDVRPLVLMGVETIVVLSMATVCFALHLIDRIVRAARSLEPFAAVNARRLRWVGMLTLLTWLLDVGHEYALKSVFESATVDGLWKRTFAPLHEHDLTFLALSFCAFAASAVLRYGADLERERELTI